MSPNMPVCQKRQNCSNNGFLVIDANFIIYVIESICGKIEEELNGSSRAEKFNAFCNVLDSILNNAKPCSLDSTFWTSDIVYLEEISPTHRLSSLRRKIHAFNTMCSGRNLNYQRVDQILRNHLEQIDTSDQEILEVKGLYAYGPMNRDASLIVCSIKKSVVGYKTILMTDDDDLIKRLPAVRNRGNMTLGTNNYPCRSVFSSTFLSFLELVHDCCNLSSEDYAYSISHKFLMEAERADTLPKVLRERKKRGIIRAFDRFIMAIRKKGLALHHAT